MQTSANGVEVFQALAFFLLSLKSLAFKLNTFLFIYFCRQLITALLCTGEKFPLFISMRIIIKSCESLCAISSLLMHLNLHSALELIDLQKLNSAIVWLLQDQTSCCPESNWNTGDIKWWHHFSKNNQRKVYPNKRIFAYCFVLLLKLLLFTGVQEVNHQGAPNDASGINLNCHGKAGPF